MVFPSDRVDMDLQKRLKRIVASIALELNITGAFNIQALHRDGKLAVIETNLRASRSLPFVSKILGVDFAATATRAIMDIPPAYDSRCDQPASYFGRVGVKAPQFSFRRLPGADPVLGVEMRSTGEVAAMDGSRSAAYLKALMAAGLHMPAVGSTAFLSLPSVLASPELQGQLRRAVLQLLELGFRLACSPSVAEALDVAAGAFTATPGFERRASPALAQAFTDNNVSIVFELSG